MTTSKILKRQLRDLRDSLPPVSADTRPLLTIVPTAWPDDAFTAYLEACATGDRERQFDLIERNTGHRPSDRPDEIVIITVELDRDLLEAGVVG